MALQARNGWKLPVKKRSGPADHVQPQCFIAFSEWRSRALICTRSASPIGGVPKLPVTEARITPEGVVGDRQQNRDIHGGIDRAVCIFSLEVIEALQAEGHSIKPGSSGENLTIAGLEWSQLQLGGPAAHWGTGLVGGQKLYFSL